MKKLWIAIARLGGWHFILPPTGSRPEIQRCIFATAPHTSMADYLVGTAYLWQLGVNGRIFIKKEFFRWPLGPILRRLGCIPIDRGNRHNGLVDAAVNEFAKGGPLAIAITPEGTRKATRRWKRGFWEIAHRAGVPIVPAFLDFQHRTIHLGDAFYTTDDADADILYIRSLFSKEMAKHPDQFIEIEKQ
ncbi:MAG: 1-acyl-sn-glycerol-3-phosphate acyltransferase [Bacteroidales bacterium]|nr:1-acyl-sn-glycerol-3-phosphate acyltransferase [Bacteroidales bacterium]